MADEVREEWGELEMCVAGDGRVIWVGDNNAEFEEDMVREGREGRGTEQDRCFQEVVRNLGLVRHSVGRPNSRSCT